MPKIKTVEHTFPGMHKLVNPGIPLHPDSPYQRILNAIAGGLINRRSVVPAPRMAVAPAKLLAPVPVIIREKNIPGTVAPVRQMDSLKTSAYLGYPGRGPVVAPAEGAANGPYLGDVLVYD